MRDTRDDNQTTAFLAMSADERPTLQIGNREVGDTNSTYVIAEAGVNHDGSLDAALKMIRAAKQAGANAVKFQAFRTDELVSKRAETTRQQSAASGKRDQRSLLAGLELSADALRALADACRLASIDFIATPFDLTSLSLLAELDVPAIKIASTDLTNHPLISAALNVGVPLIISTGASYENEVDECVARVMSETHGRAALLHCVSAYPVDPANANLRRIQSLARRYNLVTGYSDHTTSTDTGALAVTAGASIVEKHFTLDRKRVGPDHAMSLTPKELGAYIRNIRAIETQLGDGSLDMQEIELEVRDKAGRSVVAARPIRAGETLTEASFIAKRPGGGIGPDELVDLVGRVAARDIDPEEPLEWSMVR